MALRLRRGGRRLILGEFGNFARSDTDTKNLEDFVAARNLSLEDDDDVVDFDVTGGLGWVAIDGDAAKAAGVGGESAGFEGAHGPKPLIQSNG